jgi:hypothetical protein
MFPVANWLAEKSLPEIRQRLVRPIVRNGWVRADAVDRLCAELWRIVPIITCGSGWC